MESFLLDQVNTHKIKIEDCRGQSYDNASNMSGQYNGLQAKIKQKNPLAEYVPCAGHSLNLVGSSAAEACPASLDLFSFLQSIYNFFSASTHRWDVLKSHLKYKRIQRVFQRVYHKLDGLPVPMLALL